MKCELPKSFFHHPPEGYFYVEEQFKGNIIFILPDYQTQPPRKTNKSFEFE